MTGTKTKRNAKFKSHNQKRRYKMRKIADEEIIKDKENSKKSSSLIIQHHKIDSHKKTDRGYINILVIESILTYGILLGVITLHVHSLQTNVLMGVFTLGTIIIPACYSSYISKHIHNLFHKKWRWLWLVAFIIIGLFLDWLFIL